jgi:hypothetical protein
MDEDASKSKVDDAELEQMIANIKGQPTAAPATAGSSGSPASVSAGGGQATADGGLANAAADLPAPTAPEPTTPPPTPSSSTPTTPPLASPTSAATPAAPQTSSALPPELDNIKRGALAELRPLVDKLTLPPEEKFNTILLIIRSTDDVTLLPAAYATARAIPDENQRAQALLNVIKEVDFFGQQGKPTT